LFKRAGASEHLYSISLDVWSKSVAGAGKVSISRDVMNAM
jgi:hypothetical protein